jgi:hypothetical protein
MKVYTLRASEWALLFLGCVFPQCILGTYGDNTAITKVVNTGLKLQLPMVSICNILLPKYPENFVVNA